MLSHFYAILNQEVWHKFLELHVGRKKKKHKKLFFFFYFLRWKWCFLGFNVGQTAPLLLVLLIG
jgi:hypothetical protein